jgi:nitrogen fixation protein FixH
MITNDATLTGQIKSNTAVAKAAFNKKKALIGRKLDLI